jgi:tetratricopeptide (TPR) repeat protein
VKRSAKRRWIGPLLLVAVLLLIINSAYIAAFSTSDFFYVINSLLHPLLGIAAGLLLLAFILQRRSAFKGPFGWALIVLAAVAFGSGIYLAIAGMTSRDPRVLEIHVAFALAALFIALPFLQAGSAAVPAAPTGQGSRVAQTSRFSKSAAFLRLFAPKPQSFQRQETLRYPLWRWGLAALIACGAFFAGVTLYHHFYPNAYYAIRNPQSPPLTMAQEGGGPHSLVWPSSAQIVNRKPLPESYFMTSKSCEPCHRDIYHQWYRSMHHYASFNDQWYKKSIEYMQDVIGIKPSLWCGGCHDQALSLTGYMEKDPIRRIEDTPAGQAGLGCISCHSMVHVASTMGNGDYTFERPTLDKYVASSNPLLRGLAYYEVMLNPKAHETTFFKPFMHDRAEEPLMCSVCHKVHLDVPVNHYRWVRGFDEYDNWQASGTDWQGARSFYYPPKPETCIDCHMPLVRSHDFGNINGYVHSHDFAAANTAVPASYGDWKQVAAVEHFLKGALSVDIFALAEEPATRAGGPAQAGRAGPAGSAPQLATTFAQGEESVTGGVAASSSGALKPAELIAPLGKVPAVLHRGQTVGVEVVVRTLKLGHFFPGGTVDAYDCWLELKAVDNKGHIIFWSGGVADGGRGPVDPGAHFYRSYQLDAHGNMINKRNAWATRAVVYTHLIPPGAADTVHYRLEIPKDCGSKITLTAKLNYRKFTWWYTHWAFAGVRDPSQKDPAVAPGYDDTHWVFTGSMRNVSAKYKRIPNLPIVVIARQSVTLPVIGRGMKAPFSEEIGLDRSGLYRWNDYGIGLLLQGDFKGAERAFDIVTRIDPGYANGWVNVARAMIQEGNTDAAKPLLAKALKLDPNLGSGHYFCALALKADGDYAGAYRQFALAAARYPNDRVVRDQMGEMAFLQRKYKQAVEEFQRTLGIDPEDLFAHYNLMLCYMGLGNPRLADREKELYLRFKANEIARSITGPFRLTHPDDNNESLPVHEHVSVPLRELDHPPAWWYEPYLPQLEAAASARQPNSKQAGNVIAKTEVTTKAPRHEERPGSKKQKPYVGGELSGY